MQKPRVIDSRHPDYVIKMGDWDKFRYVLDGGKNFVEKYLKWFSLRESSADFANRKEYSYNPSHAKSAVLDVRNSIYERLGDVLRQTTDADYKAVCAGLNGGVDKKNASMTYFMGKQVLTELLFLGKVGIFIDKDPIDPNETRAAGVKMPYMYIYRAEDILSWSVGHDQKLDNVLLRDRVEVKDSQTGLVIGTSYQYRYLARVQPLGKVLYRVYQQLGNGNEEIIRQGFLDLPTIPFIVAELTGSLLNEVADYQIALLNMESSDIYAAIKNNFSFYVEQFDQMAENAHAKIKSVDSVDAEEDDEESQQTTQIHGVAMGRKYPKGVERPGFINPSPEPLRVSMEKGDKIRTDIYRLVNLNLSMLESRHASEASRKMDYRGLETNLSYIAMELEFCEIEIANIWRSYQNSEAIHVIYPKDYELRGTSERRTEAIELLKGLQYTTNQAVRKQLVKKAARLLFTGDLNDSDITILLKKIEDSGIIITSDEIQSMIEVGVLSRKYVGEEFGVPDGVVKDAMDEHAERAANLVKAQGDANGGDGDANRQRKADSQNADLNADGTRRTRGKA